jgi:dihydroorotate dehydrogenase (fumarate)
MGVDLRTIYLGLELRNPLIASASPLTGHLDILRQLEAAGVAAVVMPSLFEEQLERDERAVRDYFEYGIDQFVTTLSDRFELDLYNTGPANYLRGIEQAKKALSIPVIGSLNGAGVGSWARHAQLLEEAGADAVELNVYFVPTEPAVTAVQVEQRYLDLVAAVREVVTVPLAVKLGPYFSSLPNLACRLVEVGVDGLVLFNRFFEPDFALETLRVNPCLRLSTSAELRLPMRWIAILRPQLSISLAASTGVHTSEDVLKLLLVGADVAMTASALLQHGPTYSHTMLEGLGTWLAEKGYDSIGQIKGRLSRQNCADPSAFERANYINMIATGRFTPDNASGRTGS